MSVALSVAPSNSLLILKTKISMESIKSGIMDKVVICIFLHESLMLKLKHGVSINIEEIEAFSIEIINKNSKNILISTQYRRPSSKGII